MGAVLNLLFAIIKTYALWRTRTKYLHVLKKSHVAPEGAATYAGFGKKQWAAVRTHSALMMAPPQNRVSPDVARMKEALQGNS